jgi:RNA polymerase sigma-70 factor, ECF subfamily
LVSDEQIIGRVLNGQVENYRELLDRHQSGVFRVAYRMLGRREDAEDVVQEAFVRAYTKLSECRDREKFGAWVRRIAVNVCLRRFSRETPSDDLDEISDGAEDPVEQEVIRRAEMREIQEAVACLPTAYRTILVLRYEEELDLKEIAELLGEQPGTIYTRLHRARKHLARQLEVMADEMS